MIEYKREYQIYIMSKYLIEGKKNKVIRSTEILLGLSVFIYIVCAYAFEWSPATSRYSTIAIYIVFLFGVAYVFLSDQTIILNIYTGSMVILCIYIYLMTQVGAFNSRAYENAYDYLTCSILCYIIFHITQISNNTPKYILWGFVSGSLLLSLRFINIHGSLWNLMTQGINAKEFRIGEGIMNSNVLGSYMATSILSAFIILLIKKQVFFVKIILFAFIILSVFMLIMSASKKAVIFFVLTVLAVSFYRIRGVNCFKGVCFFVGLIILTVLFYQELFRNPLFHTIGYRLNNLFDTIKNGYAETDTDAVRFDMIRVGWEEFLKNPLFGNGAGHSFELFGTYSHNNFIEMLMNYGLIGFGLYYAHYFCLLPKLFCLVKKRDIIAAFFLFYSLFLLILSFGWVVYYERVTQINIAAAWGYVLNCSQRDVIA